MLINEDPEIKFALHAVRQASLLARQVQAELAPQFLSKSDLSPVTVADFAAQALVGYLLGLAYPADVLVAEEEALGLADPDQIDTLKRVTRYVKRFVPEAEPESVCSWIDRGTATLSHRFWTLDPVDGTKGFLRGDQYAVALALIEGGQVKLSVLGCPNLSDAFRPDPYGQGSLVVATHGEGAWTTALSSPGNYERLNVSDRGRASSARILRSYESGHTYGGKIDDLISLLKIGGEPVRMDSQAKYAILASGKADLLLRLPPPANPGYREKIWDQAAGSLVVEEAGGRITDLDGKALDFSTGRQLAHNRGVLATNGFLHDSVLEALKEIGA
jgi:3'(2'), 5'-bisphosphate nucleotidase